MIPSKIAIFSVISFQSSFFYNGKGRGVCVCSRVKIMEVEDPLCSP